MLNSLLFDCVASGARSPVSTRPIVSWSTFTLLPLGSVGSLEFCVVMPAWAGSPLAIALRRLSSKLTFCARYPGVSEFARFWAMIRCRAASPSRDVWIACIVRSSTPHPPPTSSPPVLAHDGEQSLLHPRQHPIGARCTKLSEPDTHFFTPRAIAP